MQHTEHPFELDAASGITRELAAIWEDLFPGSKIDAQADFHSLGGHSLLAIRLITRIQEHFSVAVSLGDVLEKSTLSELAGLIEERAASGGSGQLAEIPRRGASDSVPLAPTQEYILFESLLRPGVPHYNDVASLHLGPQPDLAALQCAFNQLLARHEAFRAGFDWKSVSFSQKIQSLPEVEIPVVDFGEFAEEERPSRAETYASEWAAKPFELDRPPLIRAFLGRHSAEDNRLYVVAHHIIVDAYTLFELLPRELGELYAATLEHRPPRLPEMPVSYTDAVSWKREQAGDNGKDDHLPYWRNQLKGYHPFRLPPDRPARAGHDGPDARRIFHLTPELSRRIKALARKNKATPFTVLLAAFNALLYRQTGEADITLGSVAGGREHPHLQPLAGCFLNFFALRNRVSGEDSLNSLVGKAGRTIVEAIEHQEVPLLQVLKGLKDSKQGSRKSLYRTMFLMEPARDLQPGQWPVNQLEFYPGASKLDLTFEMDESEGRFFGRVEFRSALYSAERIDQLIARYQALLQIAVEQPDCPLEELTGEDSAQGEARGEVELPYPTDPERRLYDPMEAMARKSPGSVAVIFGEEAMTYGQLKQYSDNIAWRLQQEVVETGEVVAVITRRTFWLPAALFGVIKSGAAYLPIDPDLPADRIHYFLENSRVRLALVQDEVDHEPTPGVTPFRISELARQPAGGKIEDRATPSDLAYVLYTSGSTGKPKGSMIEHRSIMNRLQWWSAQYQFTSRDVQIQKTPITFDVSLHELFQWSLVGARLVIPEPGAEKDPAALIRLVEKHQVTQIHFVPSMLEVFLAYLQAFGNARGLFSLRFVYCSGEALPPATVESFQRLVGRPLGVGLHNLYGPTEAAVEVSHFDCGEFQGGSIIPIGKAVWNTRLHVLDPNRKPVPEGEQGELYIAGIQVARGYINQPELSRKAFLPDPFSDRPGALMYKTGDVVRQLPDGNIEYLGRNDFQVKIRGVRIEPAEIEAAARDFPGLTGAACLARSRENGEKYLALYYTTAGADADSFREALMRHLEEALPCQMVPSALVSMTEFPLNISGKLDRKALPEPKEEPAAPSSGSRPGEDPLFQVAASIWSEILATNNPGPEADFFDHGGHSLLAIRLLVRVEEAMGKEISLPEFFQNPTLGALTRLLREGDGEDTVSVEPADPEARQSLELTWGQRRMLFLDQLDRSRKGFNIVFAASLQGELSRDVLREAVRQLLEAHEALRTCFPSSGDTWRAKRLPADAVLDQVFRWRDLENQFHEEAENVLFKELWTRELDMGSGPLCQVQVYRFAGGRQLVGILLHHIIADETAEDILWKDLAYAYNQVARGTGESLPATRIQTGDIALWEMDPARKEEHTVSIRRWKEHLRDAPTLLELPIEKAPPKEIRFQGRRIAMQLESETSARLDNLFRSHGATPFMGFLSAWGAFLGRLSGQKDLLIGTPVSMRSFAGLERTIGFLLNTVPLRIKADFSASYIDWLKNSRREFIEVYGLARLPFDRLVNEIPHARDPGRSPMVQVMLVMGTSTTKPPAMDGLQASLVPSRPDSAKFDLTLFVFPEPGGFRVELEYRTDLFHDETAAEWLQDFTAFLTELSRNPEMPLDQLGCLAGDHILNQASWSRGPSLESPRESLVDLLRKAQQQYRQRPALDDGERCLSYGELFDRANRLAGYLRKESSSQQPCIGICGSRSVDLLTGILGILLSGKAYVPLDPGWPQKRLAAVIGDAPLDRILSVNEEDGRIVDDALSGMDRSDYVHTRWDEAFTGTKESPHTPAGNPAPEDLAYIIYTSGSTGRPKGVLVEQRNVAASTRARLQYYGEAPERFMLLSPAIFDSSVAGIFWTLASGGCLMLPPPGLERDPAPLADWIATHGVSHYLCLPSLHNLLIGPLAKLKHRLRAAIVAGESCSPALPGLHHKKLSGVRLFNEYGPTEGTVWVTAAELEDGPEAFRVPIGGPIPGSTVHVVNEQLRYLPRGSLGELVIGGPGLARGYWRDAALTDSRFISGGSGHLPEGRFYRTGDLVRWSRKGSLVFAGRVDAQVKIRGFRIEPGEIESAIKRLEGVLESAVVLSRQDAADEQLVAWVQVVGEQPYAGDIRRHLQSFLPAYMIPSSIETTAQPLPSTATGKVDRQALARRPLSALRDRPVAGEREATPTEHELRELWQHLLRRQDIGLEDDFFELGGHSFLAIRLFAAIEKRFGRSLSVATLYQASTVQALAAVVEQPSGTTARSSYIIPIRKGTSPYHLFCIHPRDGGVLIYKELGETLDSEISVTGIEAPWLRGELDESTTIRGMARRYLPDLENSLNEGETVHLCGFSVGGLIALEIARLMEQSGRRVGSVFLLDTYNPGRPPLRTPFARRWKRRLLPPGARGPVRFARNLVHVLSGTGLAWWGGLRERLSLKRVATARTRGEDLPMQMRLIEARANIVQACDNYRPEPVQTRLVLIRAEDEDSGFDRQRDLGWEEVAASGLEIHDVEGDHTTFLKPPHVAGVADCLTRVMQRSPS